MSRAPRPAGSRHGYHPTSLEVAQRRLADATTALRVAEATARTPDVLEGAAWGALAVYIGMRLRAITVGDVRGGGAAVGGLLDEAVKYIGGGITSVLQSAGVGGGGAIGLPSPGAIVRQMADLDPSRGDDEPALSVIAVITITLLSVLLVRTALRVAVGRLGATA